jgi:hypothetical protein
MTPEPLEIIELAEGLTYEKRSDGINIYTICKMTVEGAKAWETKVIELDAKAAADGEHIRTIYDVHISGFGVSAVSAIFRVAQVAPENLVESTATVLHQPGLLLTMLRGVVRRLPRRARDSIAFLDSVDGAIVWLDERKSEIGY